MKRADFSRTCQGCEYAKAEPWDKGRIFYRCIAPGPRQGRSVGIERYLPYIPAWCEKMNREEEMDDSNTTAAAALSGRGNPAG